MSTKNLLAFLLSFFILFGAAAQKRKNRHKNVSSYDVVDSMVHVETDITFKQKDYLGLLKGDWNLIVMREQARMTPQQLSGVSLVLRSDSTFSVFAACGTTKGNSA